MSLRAALGASRGQLTRQLLVETLVHFALGGFGGLILGRVLLTSLLVIAPATIPRLDQVGMDSTVLLFTSLLTLFTGLLFGLIPAWTTSRTDITSALREGGHGAIAGRNRLRDALVVGQVAATVVLLICSGLLLRSFHQLQQVDAGFVAETPVQAYEPYHQFSFNNITVVARAKSHPEDLTTAMRQQVLSIDPQQPVHTEKTMARIVEDSLGQRYFSLLLVGAFALVALLLAVVGLYGVISYGVARRTREFGVRLSIGASRRDIASMVLAQSSRLIGAGLAIGLLGALFSARLLHSLLYGIGARDPFTFAG